MKRLFLFLCFAIFIQFASGQSKNTTYIIEAPDGSTAMTIITLNEHSYELTSELDFYKYELLDLRTSESVLSGRAKDRKCMMNTTRLAAGTYNLRFFTKNFIVTSKINLGRAITGETSEQVIASNE